jgi:hypothetical protein
MTTKQLEGRRAKTGGELVGQQLRAATAGW